MANNSTQKLIEVSDIQDSIILTKDGALHSILEASAINFELRSEDEQIAITQNFQRFLNSIDFPIQIMVSSRQLSMEPYLQLIDQATNGLANELLKIQGLEYQKFIKELLELSNIMSKKFYICIPFYPIEAPSGTDIKKGLLGFLKPSSRQGPQLSPEDIEKYRPQMLQRVNLVYDGLLGASLKTRLLEGNELVNLIYGYYNATTEAPLNKEATTEYESKQ